MTKPRARVLAALALLAVSSASSGPARADRAPLQFGVLNQQSPVLTAERWNPILSYVSTVSGVPLRLKMGPTWQETDAMMARGEFDFIYTNHNFQPQYDGIGYRVIARWGGDAIRCVIAVYRTFRFPSPKNGSVRVTDGLRFEVSDEDD